MCKVIWLVRFNEGMPRDEAVRHWREVHGPLGVKVPGMHRYIQNHWISPVGETAVDGRRWSPTPRTSSRRAPWSARSSTST